MKSPWKLPRRAPVDPNLRRIYVAEIRRAFLGGGLDLPITPELISLELLKVLFA